MQQQTWTKDGKDCVLLSLFYLLDEHITISV